MKGYKIKSLILILATVLILGSVINPINVYATDTTTTVNNSQSSANEGDQSNENAGSSGGSSGDSTSGWANGGWSLNNEGIRIYLIDLEGNVISNVYDFYFDNATDIPFEKNLSKGYEWHDSLKGRKTAIGNGIAKNPKPITEIDVLSGFPHITLGAGNGRVSNGQAIINWCLSMDENGIYQINHVICNIFSDRDKSTYKGEDIYDAYMNDKVKCVIESLYWFVPAKYLGTTESGGASTVAVNYLDDTNAKYFVYGNIQFIAEQNVKNHNKIHNDGAKNVGGFVSYCGNLWPYALQLIENEREIGWGVPAQLGSSVDQSDIGALNSDGLISGYGLHIYDVKLSEPVWGTWKASTYKYVNGEQVVTVLGGKESPSYAPFMGEAVDEEIKTRPVKIVKIYDTIEIDQSGNEEIIETVIKHQDSMSACRTIEVQDETNEFTVSEWFTSGTKPNTSDGWKTSKNWYDNAIQKGEHADVVEVIDYTTTEDDYDYLTVHLIKKVFVDAPIENELVLTESEITHSYEMKNVVDGGLFNLVFNYGSMSGICDYSVKKHDYDEEMIECGASCQVDGGWLPYHGPGSGAHGYRKVNCTHVVNCRNSFTLNNQSDKNYEYKFKNGLALDETIMANKNEFRPIEDYAYADGYKGNVTSINGDDIEVTNLNYKFTLFRGDDKPTLAVYRSTSDATVNALLGSPQGKTANNVRKSGQGMYQKNVNLRFIGETVDGTTRSTCPDHSTKGVTVNHTFKNDSSYNYNGDAKVYYYSGQVKSPAKAKVNLNSVITEYFGSGAQGQANKEGVITSSHMTVLSDSPTTVKFTPYVKMTYRTTDSEEKKEVYVLSQHSSEMDIYSGMTVGFKSNSSDYYNVDVRSDQWSNHATALKNWGKNNLLAGGSIYDAG